MSATASTGLAARAPTDATASIGAGGASPSLVAAGARPPGSLVDVTMALHLAPVGNRREHPMSRARRTRREIAAVLQGVAGRTPPPLPVVLVLVRVGWNLLDVDGLVACVKGPIDALTRHWLGVDDRDRRLFWRLAQSTTRERRLVRGVREAAATLRIVVRPWRCEDGDDPLRVLARVPGAAP